MTEEEAFQRWCPHRSQASSLMIIQSVIPVACRAEKDLSKVLDNTIKILGEDPSNCIASGCAMWVKAGDKVFFLDEQRFCRENETLTEGKKEYGMRDYGGHCGLAK